MSTSSIPLYSFLMRSSPCSHLSGTIPHTQSYVDAPCPTDCSVYLIKSSNHCFDASRHTFRQHRSRARDHRECEARLQGDIDLRKTLYETQRVRARSAEQDVKNLKTELGNVGILLNQKDIELGELKQENAALKAKTARLGTEGTKKGAI
jgi:hypothetical protein